MMRTFIRLGIVAGALGLGACKLEVLNPNSPTYPTVRGSPQDLENFIGAQYRRFHDAIWGTAGNFGEMANVQSFENYAELSNNCQAQRVSLPTRPGNDNSVGNQCAGNQSRLFVQESEVARSVSDGLRRMDQGLTFGSPAIDARNRMFAEFLRGLSLGYLALYYDSASVITPQDSISALGTAVPGVLAGYQEVMAGAITALDNSVTAAATATVSPLLPGTWISGFNPTNAQFVQLVRSWRALFRANVARTPAERAAVDWDKVIADAQNGITADWKITANTTTGPRNSFLNQTYSYNTWHQMTPFIIGMADNSGAYAAWIGQEVSQRGGGTWFFMATADQRFPQGANRTAQQTDITINNCQANSAVCKRYFVNRQTSDPQGAFWGRSQYDHARFAAFAYNGSTTGVTGGNGPFPFLTVAEINLLEAEGQLRKGNTSAAVALINQTRAACGPDGAAVSPGCTARPAGNGDANRGGGLPAIPTSITFAGSNSNMDTRAAGDDVPGGASCVPLVPVNAAHSGGGTTRCGGVWEALKWEMRIESAYTSFTPWYLYGRGWGDLPEGTPYQWAPPWEELTTRGTPATQVYSIGGTFPGKADRSHYGW